MTHKEVDRNKKYTEEDFKPYIKRRSDWDARQLIMLPNWKAIEPGRLLASICYSDRWPTLHGIIRSSEAPPSQEWGTMWLNTLYDGKSLKGTGYAAVYQGFGRPPWCATFAICDHKTEYMPTANPSRGRHDMFCTLCGLDMSYDSSD